MSMKFLGSCMMHGRHLVNCIIIIILNYYFIKDLSAFLVKDVKYSQYGMVMMNNWAMNLFYSLFFG